LQNAFASPALSASFIVPSAVLKAIYLFQSQRYHKENLNNFTKHWQVITGRKKTGRSWWKKCEKLKKNGMEA